MKTRHSGRNNPKQYRSPLGVKAGRANSPDLTGIASNPSGVYGAVLKARRSSQPWIRQGVARLVSTLLSAFGIGGGR